MIITHSKGLAGIFVNMFLVSALVVSGMSFSGGQAQAAGENLLSNSGFEESGENRRVALGWQSFGDGYKRVKRRHGGSWGVRLENKDFSQMSGASQRIDLQQTEAKPVAVTGYVKGKRIQNGSGGYFGASLYAEIHLQDGSIVYWNSVGNYGTFGWRRIGFNTGTLLSVNQPIDHIFIVPILAKATGRAFFDDLSVQEYDPAEAAVTVMFDDGELSTYSEGYPMMDKYGFDGSTVIITSEVGEDEFMTWRQLRELQREGWEIVSHGVSHRDLTAMSKQRRNRELRKSKRQLTRRGLSVKNFALPFGAYNSDIMAAGVKWYRSLRAYEQGGNPQGTLPWDVKVRGVTAETSPAMIGEWIDEAKAKGLWLVISYHRITETGDDVYYTTPDDLAAMLKVINDSGVNVVTYDEGLSRFGAL